MFLGRAAALGILAKKKRDD